MSYGHECGPTFGLGLLEKVDDRYRFRPGQDPEGHTVVISSEAYSCEPKPRTDFDAFLRQPFEIELRDQTIRLFNDSVSYRFVPMPTEFTEAPPATEPARATTTTTR